MVRFHASILSLETSALFLMFKLGGECLGKSVYYGVPWW